MDAGHPSTTFFLLILSFIFPLGAIAHLLLLNSADRVQIRRVSSYYAVATLIAVILMQFTMDFSFEFYSLYKRFLLSDSLNLHFTLGLDGLSYYLILLTALLTLLCITVVWETVEYFREFVIVLFAIEALLFNVFLVTDFLFFYIFFEAILIPMFIMIGVWGGRSRKVGAAYQFFFYTFLGSIFMLLAILYVYCFSGTSSIFHVLTYNFVIFLQLTLWAGFFISLAVKVPMTPIHLWLPEAHTEAPTAGSVLLAGVLLKMGTYGMIRFLLPIFPYASRYFAIVAFAAGVFAIVYTSLTALRQSDLKKAIAYSSVAHMNLVIIGLFTCTLTGLKGGTFLMLSHGVVSSALFIIIGILYERYRSRNIRYYGGLVLIMPLFVSFFLIQILSNMGFPGTSGFIGEFLVLLLAYNSNTLVAFAATSGVVLSAAYSIWLFNRICFGPLKQKYIRSFADTNERESLMVGSLGTYTVTLGIYPNVILNTIDASLLRVII